MQGDELTICLFFVGLAVTVVCTGFALSGWRHKTLVLSLFVIGALLFFLGIGWYWIKDVPPATITRSISTLAISPVSWFVVIMLSGWSLLHIPPHIEKINKANIPSSPVLSTHLSDIFVNVDFRDALPKISFTPAVSIRRLRLRLEWSRLTDGIGIGILWTQPIAMELDDLNDLLGGIRRITQILDNREVYPIPEKPQRLLNWHKTETPVTQGIYRVRLTFVCDNLEEIKYAFFMHSYLDENKNMAIVLIGQEHCDLLRSWNSAAVVTRAVLGGPA